MGDGVGLEADRGSCGGAKASQRSNTTVHVCWHRNTSISYSDQLRAFQVSERIGVYKKISMSTVHVIAAVRVIINCIRFRTNSVDFCYENSKIAMVGKSFGSCLPTFVYSSTNHIETTSHWLACRC